MFRPRIDPCILLLLTTVAVASLLPARGIVAVECAHATTLAIGLLFFLSGALYPLSNLPAALTVATRVDPLTYGIDGLRAALVDLGQIGMAVDAAVLVGVAAMFLVLGAWAFSRIQI